MNGVVQYVPGKGIITKQEVRTGGGTRRSGGGSSSGGNHGGSGDNSGDTGNQKEKTKITVLYKERESDKVLDTVSYEGTEGDKITLEWRQFTGYTLCAGQPQEAVFGKEDSTVTIYYLKNSDSGKIIVQCVEKESGKLLAQKEVVGEVGERYVVQYPAYSGYKLLDEEQKVLVFEKEPQTVIINYRVKLDNEDPDQRIVLADNLKAISPNTSEQNKIVNQIYDQIFDYNVDANANGGVDFTIYPEFKVQPKGSISFDLLTQLDLMLNLAGEVNKDFKIFGGDDKGNVNIDISGNWEIFNKVWLHLQYPKQPKTITLSKNTSVNATNNIGWDISQQFTGYDSESKTLKPKTVTDGYTFQCPAYIKDKDEYFSVTKLEAKEKECVGLDLSKAENLEEIVLDSVSIKQLDVSANKKLKTVSIDNCRTLEIFTGNGIAFPTQLTWYKDKEKTQQVKSAKDFAAGETIYSENYGLKPVTMKDYQLLLNEDTAVIAVDQFGRNISSDYEGHENGWVKVVKNGDNFSFDCPQYIKIAEDGWCFQVTEINTSKSVRCEKLDLSRAPKIHTVSLYNNELHTLEVAPDNVITSLSVGIFDEASTSKTLWDLDFSEMPLLTKLSLTNRSLKNGLNLSQHKNLKELLLGNVEFSSLNLPENASLKNLELIRCNGISRLDLSKQISLELLTVNYCENIALVDVSSCPNCQWGDNYVPAVMFTKFRGNGQMFPYGDWYADENFTEKVTKNTYDGHSLIYRKTNDEQAKKSFEKIKPSMLDDAEKEENEDLNSSDKNTATSSNAKKKN